MERGRLRPVGRVQAAVPRAERQAVGFADRRAGDDGGRQEEGVGHPAHETQLLPVLLAEVGAIGRGNLQELEDDGQHGVEVPGTVRSLQDLRHVELSDTIAIAVRIQIASCAGTSTKSAPASRSISRSSSSVRGYCA